MNFIKNYNFYLKYFSLWRNNFWLYAMWYQ